MHTGIDTGLVVARRSDARAGDFALTGDTVNTAARLRSAGRVARGRRQRDDLAAGLRRLRRRSDRAGGAQRQGAGRSSPTASAASARHRPRPTARWSGATRSCATSAPSPRRARSAGAAASSSCAATPASASRASSPSSSDAARTSASRATPRAVLDFGAETGRDAVRSLARSLLGVAGAADEATRRAAIERASRARSIAAEQLLFLHDLLDVAPPAELRALAAAMSTDGARAGLAARLVRPRRRGRRGAAAAPGRRGHPLGRRLDPRAPRRARRAGREAAAAAGDDDALRRRSERGRLAHRRCTARRSSASTSGR